MNTLTASLFVGGESRRMGTDKATLILDGEPLWARQVRILRKLSPEKILISARTKPAWCPAEIETVLDGPPSRGPLSGLVAALKKLQTTHLLALAIDLPQMTTEHLQKIKALAQPGIGVIPQIGNFSEPLSAIYPREALETSEHLLAGDDVSLQKFTQILLEQNRARIFPLSRAERRFFYRNVNTPDELK